MKKTNLTRKEFLIKSSRCIGGLACTSLTTSLIQTCNKPAPLNDITSETIYISECSCHGAKFDQNGKVMQHPDNTNIDDLHIYDSIFNNNQIIITNQDESVIIEIENHPNLENIGGISSTNSNAIDSNGLLLYRETENNIIVLSRTCTHQACKIGEFENA